MPSDRQAFGLLLLGKLLFVSPESSEIGKSGLSILASLTQLSPWFLNICLEGASHIS